MAYDGQKMGCSDSGSPLFVTETQLSRLHDAIEDIRFVLGGDEELFKPVWSALPHHLKFEYNYARWTYRARRPTVG